MITFYRMVAHLKYFQVSHLTLLKNLVGLLPVVFILKLYWRWYSESHVLTSQQTFQNGDVDYQKMT